MLKFDKEKLNDFAKISSASEDKIDLTDLNNDNILLRYEITRGGVLLFGDPQDYEELKAFSFRDYVDAKPLFDLEDKIIKKRKITLIQDEMIKLSALAKYTIDEVAKDFVKQAAVERILERIIARAIDINQHIVAESEKKNFFGAG